MNDLPDAHALAHLRAELDHLRARLVGHLRRLQRAEVLPPASALFPGTTTLTSQLEARAREACAPTPLEPNAEAEIARAQAALIALAASSPDLPLLRLRRAFGLDDASYELLLLTLAADFDPTFPRLFGLLHDHFERQYPTLHLLSDVLSPTTPVRHLLDAESPLLRMALVQLAPRPEHTPTALRPLLPDPRILRFVQGFDGLDDKLGSLARLERAPPEVAPILGPKDEPQFRALLKLVDDHRARPEALPAMVLRGPEGGGKHLWARHLARCLGLALLRLDLVALKEEFGGLEAGLRVALREAALQGAMLCLDGWARLVEPPRPAEVQALRDPGPRLDASRALERVLRDAPLFVLTTEDGLVEPPLLTRGVKALSLAMPDLSASMALWKHFIPRDRPKAQGLTVKRLAQSFRLTPGHIQEAIAEATNELPADAPLSFELLSAAIKRQTRHRLGDNATLVQTDYQWTDLVVSVDVDFQLRELIGRWRSKSLVFETWGLARRFATGQGLSVLFEGPPGTGKTMAAAIIARELDLDLYQIDLSKVVNRFIGETEKYLARIFDEAERSRVMLLFDEADALFSSRTEVKSANDRYANLEVNYLLQRVEHFTGIAVLTTNFPTALDEAFRRRIAMRVSFTKPQVAERQRLWESMLTNRSILDPKLDLEDLAYEFELTGGHIRNAVLRAAFIAATRGCLIDQELLRIAARIELKEQGLLVQGSPYEELRARS